LVSNQVVPHVEGLQGGVLALQHLQEITGDVVAANLAFRNIKLLEAEGNLVSNECLGNIRNGLFQFIVFQDEGLQAAVASQTFTYDFPTFCSNVTVTHIEVFKDLVAAQESLDHSKLFEVFI